MDAIILRVLVGVVALTASGCSVVVDTAECVSDSDCNFEGEPSMQCVESECVAVTELTQLLVPSEIRKDLVLGTDVVWVFGGVSVVSPHATLVVGDADYEVQPGATIVLSDLQQLVCSSPCPEVEVITVVEQSESK